MEISEAIEKLNELLSWRNNGLVEIRDYEFEAIDTVLEELNNRIPRKDIEEQIRQLDLIDEYEAPNGWEDEREYARDILKSLLNKE